jgi:anti-anti-sigma factor
MELNFNRNNGQVTITIIGAVDNDSAEELKVQFQDLLKHPFEEAVFDLSFVPFITSSGIGKFLIFYKNLSSNGRKMRVKGINDNLFELFKSIKLDQLFPIEK